MIPDLSAIWHREGGTENIKMPQWVTADDECITFTPRLVQALVNGVNPRMELLGCRDICMRLTEVCSEPRSKSLNSDTE